MPKEKEFYVVIQSPDQLRKEVLEGARDVISILKKYESYSNFKREKMQEVSRFNALVAEMNSLAAKARASLPSVKLQDLPKPDLPRAQGKKAPASAKARAPAQQPSSELDRLELELRKIEGKLKEL